MYKGADGHNAQKVIVKQAIFGYNLYVAVCLSKLTEGRQKGYFLWLITK